MPLSWLYNWVNMSPAEHWCHDRKLIWRNRMTGHVLQPVSTWSVRSSSKLGDCWIFYCCITPRILCRQVRYFNFLPSGDYGTCQCQEWHNATVKHIFLCIPTVTPSLAAFQYFRITVACSCKGQTRGLEWSLKVISFGFEWKLNYISLHAWKKESGLQKEDNCLKCTTPFLGIERSVFGGDRTTAW